MTLLKLCANCNQQRSLIHYGKAGNSKDGLRISCQDCEQAYKRKMDFHKSNKVVKHQTERQMLGEYYPIFCHRINEYRKLTEQY